MPRGFTVWFEDQEQYFRYANADHQEADADADAAARVWQRAV